MTQAKSKQVSDGWDMNRHGGMGMNLTALLHVKSDELQQNILSTYFTLRIGIVVLSIGLPLVLWFGGVLWGGIDGIAHSMSAYYGEHGGSMRNWFVGVLWGVGWFLYAYKGFSPLEDWLLNFAGLFAVGVAMFPCNCWADANGSNQPLHYVSAVLFFVCMALVCFLCAKDTIPLLPDEPTKESFRRRYHIIGGLLLIWPLLSFGVSYVLHQWESRTFFLEAIGVLVFAFYWWTKTREFQTTSAEQLAARGKVENRKGVGLVRVAP
ncbi:MAG TPA: DUF998 domain-containing protein [Candidatus Acidoferrales bacterium]|nr:DUF998 domain-containing protein [Candidatus Acidoferrales bacterium]